MSQLGTVLILFPHTCACSELLEFQGDRFVYIYINFKPAFHALEGRGKV